MIEDVFKDLENEMKGKIKMKYTLIEELIKDLKLLDGRNFDTMQDKIEHFKDLLEGYLIWADEDIAYYNEQKPKYDVDAIIEERKIKEYCGE